MPLARSQLATDVSVAVFDNGAVSVESLTLPPRSEREMDVAISLAAICGSDLHTALGHRSAPARTALGHEGVGIVTDADPGTVDVEGSPLSPGDRVVFSMLSTCGKCDRCSSGLSMKCRSLLKYGHESVATPPHATGTLASSVRLLPTVPVIKVPDALADVQVVSAGCAVATAAAVIEATGEVRPDTRVLVLGAGAVGTYAAAMFAHAGCVVEVRDPARERLTIINQLGIGSAGHNPDDRFPVVVEASGAAAAVVEALEVAEVGGRVVAAGSVSLGSTAVTVDPALLVRNRLTVVGVHNYSTADFARGFTWLCEHSQKLRLERLVSPPFALSALAEAFQAMREGIYHRVLVQPTNASRGNDDQVA